SRARAPPPPTRRAAGRATAGPRRRRGARGGGAPGAAPATPRGSTGRRGRPGRPLEDRRGAAVGRERVAVREADGRDGERVARVLAVLAVPRARAERIEPRPHDRAGDRQAVVDGAQEGTPAVGVAARDGKVAAQRADRVR